MPENHLARRAPPANNVHRQNAAQCDEEPIRAGLALIRGDSAAENARLQRLERMRTRLLEDETMLTEIANTWPGVDLQHLRQLRRNAVKEQEGNKPPKELPGAFPGAAGSRQKWRAER
jgi:ribosomal 50S subunit-associated protein YjgA (DUF615 family)